MDWHYTHNPKNTARFTLGITGRKNLACIGINPSTAHPGKLDATVTRVRRTAEMQGYDGWIMLNVYPQRATLPPKIHKRRNSSLHLENLETIQAFLETNPNTDIWAAWGVEIERRPFLRRCLKDLSYVIGEEKQWIHLGKLTKAGHPRHPLYLPYSARFRTFDLAAYLAK